MIVGEFDGNGRPRLDGHLFIERLAYSTTFGFWLIPGLIRQ